MNPEQFRYIGVGILALSFSLGIAYLTGGSVKHAIATGFCLGLAFYVTGFYLEWEKRRKTAKGADDNATK